MKRTPLTWLGLALALASMAYAQPINLNSPQTFSQPQSQRAVWQRIVIEPRQRRMRVDYYWTDAQDNRIEVGGRVDQTWVCRDLETPGENSECTGVGTPHACCTGVVTGTCDGLEESCFSDIFDFTIPQGAVGQQFGAGFRTLLKNAWRDNVLSQGNDGTFE
jgi:hypothetical protein